MYEKEIKKIKKLAEMSELTFDFHKPENRLLRFRNDHDTIIDVWYSNMTVGVYILAKIGRENYYERYVDIDYLPVIFNNPKEIIK